MYTDIIARALAAKALSEGGGGGGGNAKLEYHTTQYYNEHPSTIYEAGTIIVFSDYKKDGQGQDIPGVKISDGLAYALDLPFITSNIDDIQELVEQLQQQVEQLSSDVEVLNQKASDWDNKVNIEDDVQNETLVFNRN